jgi:uncharacterized membrane protein YccC
MTMNKTQVGKAARPPKVHIKQAAGQGAALAIACLISYLTITRILGRAYFISHDDELLGGMWAVVATIFVYRDSYKESGRASVSRLLATLLSFGLCLAYLLIFPFHPWAMATLIGMSAIILTMAGRPNDVITTGITIAVVMVVAGIAPQHAWKQPILRLVDTAVGIAVGFAAAWISLRFGWRTRNDTAAAAG